MKCLLYVIIGNIIVSDLLANLIKPSIVCKSHKTCYLVIRFMEDLLEGHLAIIPNVTIFGKIFKMIVTLVLFYCVQTRATTPA